MGFPDGHQLNEIPAILLNNHHGISIATMICKKKPRGFIGTSVIYIEEKLLNERSILIRVDGTLDGESIPALEKVFKHHWGEERKILLSLERVFSISGEGRDFLKEIRDKVTLLENPRFMGLKG